MAYASFCLTIEAMDAVGADDMAAQRKLGMERRGNPGCKGEGGEEWHESLTALFHDEESGGSSLHAPSLSLPFTP